MNASKAKSAAAVNAIAAKRLEHDISVEARAQHRDDMMLEVDKAEKIAAVETQKAAVETQKMMRTMMLKKMEKD